MGPFVIAKGVTPRCFYSQMDRSTQLIGSVAGNGGLIIVSPHHVNGAKLVRFYCSGPKVNGRCCAFFVSVLRASDLHRFACLLNQRVCRALLPHDHGVTALFVRAVGSVDKGFKFSPVAGLPAFGIRLKSVRQPRCALSRVFRCLSRTSGPYVMTVSRFRRVTGCPRGGVRTLLQARVRESRGDRFVFTKDRHRVVRRVFTSTTQPFCRDTSVLRLGTVPTRVCVPFVIKRFRQHGHSVTTVSIRGICTLFRKRACCVRGAFGRSFTSAPRNSRYALRAVQTTVSGVVTSGSAVFQRVLSGIPRGRGRLLCTVTGRNRTRHVASTSFVGQRDLASTDSMRSTTGGLLRGSLVARVGGIFSMASQLFTV